MANDIDTLRDNLFETLAALRDKENPMDIDRAKAISDVAQTIINSAKVEVDYMRITGGISASGFIQNVSVRKLPPPAAPSLPANNESGTSQTHDITHPKPGVTVHKIKG
ncbi:MAG: hypothetical protein KGI54_14050 [Pseudomonadota bacterium]|nr:hypothetical protein [Pseudomonadota bacterium]